MVSVIKCITLYALPVFLLFYLVFLLFIVFILILPVLSEYVTEKNVPKLLYPFWSFDDEIYMYLYYI